MTHYINQTFERLTAFASLSNNKSSIDCLAVRSPSKGSFIKYDAQRIYFMVKGKYELYTSKLCGFHLCPSHCPYCVPVLFVS